MHNVSYINQKYKQNGNANVSRTLQFQLACSVILAGCMIDT